MGLLELLEAVKEVVGHSNVRWDTDRETGEIRLYTGLTGRDSAGKVRAELFENLRQTDATVALTEMGN